MQKSIWLPGSNREIFSFKTLCLTIQIVVSSLTKELLNEMLKKYRQRRLKAPVDASSSHLNRHILSIH
jgi:hypothetical protein